jgi:hypothetical protein
MSTYSTSCQEDIFSHPLNGRLRGYFQGPVPRVPRVAGTRGTGPTPQSNVPENLLERHPPKRQEHPGAKKNTKEDLTDLYEPTSSVWGPTVSVI